MARLGASNASSQTGINLGNISYPFHVSTVFGLSSRFRSSPRPPRIVPFVALRLVHLSPSKTLDTSRPRLIAGIFTEIVMNFSFILSSITCAKPFLKPFHSGYFIGTSNQKSFHGNAKSDSKSNGNSYRILDATTSQSVNDRSIQQDDRVVHNADSYGDKGLFRPEPISHHVAVSSKAGRHQPSPSDHMAIAQTKSWAVSYEGIDEIAREQRN